MMKLKPKMKFKSIREYDWKKLFFELIVVFLGVMAAFVLNNWQMSRQDHELEIKYITGFQQDLTSNISLLEEATQSDSLLIARIQPKLFSIQNGEITIDSANVLVRLIISISKSEFHTGTYENIVNSGKLNIIKDFKLRKHIVDYHVSILGAKFVDDYFYLFFNDFIMPFAYTNISMINGELVDPKIRETNKFENTIAGYFSMVQQRKFAYSDLLEKSNLMLIELNSMH